MPGSEQQNSMFKKTKGYVQGGNPFPVTSCGRRRNDGSPLENRSALDQKAGPAKEVKPLDVDGNVKIINYGIRKSRTKKSRTR